MSPHEILTVIVSAIGVIAAVVTGFVAYQNGLKKNSCNDGEERGEVATNIEYIKDGIDDLKTRMDGMAKEHKDFELNVVREQCRLDGKIDRLREKVETEQKTMWKRIDELREERK